MCLDMNTLALLSLVLCRIVGSYYLNTKVGFRERGESSCFRYWRAKVTSALQKYKRPN